MDKLTEKTLRELTSLETDLKRCECRLQQLGKVRVAVYFSIPSQAQQSFQTLYYILEDMQRILQGKSSNLEG